MSVSTRPLGPDSAVSCWLIQPEDQNYGDPDREFTLIPSGAADIRQLLRLDTYCRISAGCGMQFKRVGSAGIYSRFGSRKAAAGILPGCAIAAAAEWRDRL